MGDGDAAGPTEVVYGSGGGRPLAADLYLPDGSPDGLRPAVAYVHGGGWQMGDRGHFAPQARHMAMRGFVGLCIEYRLSGEAAYPAAVHDAKCAIRFLRAQADRWSIDPGRIGIAGGSAGGHLAAMVATTAGDPGLEGTGGHAGFDSSVQALAAFNPALDLRERTGWEGVQRFLGGAPEQVGPDLYAEASPICHVDADLPPALLLHGTEDDVVAYSQSVRFCEAVRAAGGHSELFSAEGAGHGFFNSEPWFTPTLKRMVEFFTHFLR